MNNQLVQSYSTRAQNHETLLTALKDVNQMIQKASNLRLGKAKARVVTDCRSAVKNNNMQSLFRILKEGYEPGSMSAAQIAQPK
jgi:Bardet-Biedl syndrome 2 protein